MNGGRLWCTAMFYCRRAALLVVQQCTTVPPSPLIAAATLLPLYRHFAATLLPLHRHFAASRHPSERRKRTLTAKEKQGKKKALQDTLDSFRRDASRQGEQPREGFFLLANLVEDQAGACPKDRSSYLYRLSNRKTLISGGVLRVGSIPSQQSKLLPDPAHLPLKLECFSCSETRFYILAGILSLPCSGLFANDVLREFGHNLDLAGASMLKLVKLARSEVKVAHDIARAALLSL
ncbi:hypothetical protein C3L33_07460, partial [Rhododendron williamsianum]